MRVYPFIEETVFSLFAKTDDCVFVQQESSTVEWGNGAF